MEATCSVFACAVAPTVLLLMTAPGAYAADQLTGRAESFYTPVHMNRNDCLQFTLANGEVRELTLVNCGIETRDNGGRQWTLWADVRIDGHCFRLVYSPFDMKALSPPKVVNGMRLGLDGVKGLPEAAGWADKNKKTATHPAANPPGDVRLWVNDATMPLLPHCRPWFDLAQHRGKEGKPTAFTDYALRQDTDIHPASSRLTGNQKTGFLGGWTYGIHCGLDLQLKIGTRLCCVTDGGVWRAYDQPSGPGQNRDSLHYVVVRDSGEEWWFGNAHCNKLLAEPGKSMKAGDAYALSGNQRAGIPHAHAVVRIRDKGGNWRYEMNPWPVMWQGLRNQRAADGSLCARITAAAPVRVGEAITFSAETSILSKGAKNAEFTWRFDDGAILAGIKVTRSFAAAGVHQAILVVRDEGGVDLDEAFITVGPAGEKRSPWIVRELCVLPARLKVAQEAVFSLDAGCEAPRDLTYSWDFGDGATGTGQTVRHSYAKPGRYYPLARAADSLTGLARLDSYELDVE